MKLYFPTRTALLAVLGGALCGCNMSSPFVREDVAASTVAGTPSPTAAENFTASLPRSRVLFDSENDSFDSSEPLTYALSLTGTRYHYGGTSPKEGFDCSGFVQYVFGRFGVGLPRTAGEMAQALPKVERTDLRPGDLVFFNTNGGKFSHVGIYIGQDRFVHAPSTRSKQVMISQLEDEYWNKRLTGVRRPPAQSLVVSLLAENLPARL